MALPSSGKPTASDVVEWAKWLAKNNKGVNIDGRFGYQCWDLPNYIFERYWGFRTWGNANAMANRSQYPNRSWKIYRNHSSFVPKPGDVAVWTYGWAGHTAIVVGPSDKSHFRCVDQNWYNSNQYYGSKAAIVNHDYGGRGGSLYFVRPPYKTEPADKPDKKDDDDDKPSSSDKNSNKKEKKDTKVITVTVGEDPEEINEPEFIPHRIIRGKLRGHNPKGVTIKNAQTMCSVQDLYFDRNKYGDEKEYPHFYIDKDHIWQPRLMENIVPSDPENIVVEIAGDYSDTKSDFLLSEIYALVFIKEQLDFFKIPLKTSTIKIDGSMWRTILEHGNFDTVVDGLPSKATLEKVKKELLKLYNDRKSLIQDLSKSKTTKTVIKVDKPSSSSSSSSSSNSSHSSTKAKVKVHYSNYTFARAVSIQMTKAPQINYGNGWYNASRAATLKAMNSLEIWNSGTQKYQMLNLGKYQGISISKLNKILKGKGSLSGQGKAVAAACKKYDLNEVYLMAHAFLESGNGSSYFASGRAGVYNYFGIGAYDNNPNYAITFARNEGWTTPAKGIMGGARFVRRGYIDQGQQTLYRMRWNPQSPGNHQYATDVRWAQIQASMIKSYYDRMGLKGEYFLRDRYKQ